MPVHASGSRPFPDCPLVVASRWLSCRVHGRVTGRVMWRAVRGVLAGALRAQVSAPPVPDRAGLPEVQDLTDRLADELVTLPEDIDVELPGARWRAPAAQADSSPALVRQLQQSVRSGVWTTSAESRRRARRCLGARPPPQAFEVVAR